MFKSLAPIAYHIRCVSLVSICLCGLGCGNAGGEPPSVDVFYAAEQGDVETVRTALKAKPEIVTETKHAGRTLLHRAASGNQSNVIRLLVDAGAEIDARDGMGFTPLHAAALGRESESAMTLIDLGADYTARAKFPGEDTAPGASVLDLAALTGNAQLVESLLKKGVPAVDKEQPKVPTPLHQACRSQPWMRKGPDNEGSHRVIDLLMKQMDPDDINIRNFQRQTPLHEAARHGNVDTVKHLLKTYPKVDLDAQASGDTALHLAVASPGVQLDSKQRAATIRALVQGGAKLLPNAKGKTPLDLARETGDQTIISAFDIK